MERLEESSRYAVVLMTVAVSFVAGLVASHPVLRMEAAMVHSEPRLSYEVRGQTQQPPRLGPPLSWTGSQHTAEHFFLGRGDLVERKTDIIDPLPYPDTSCQRAISVLSSSNFRRH
jgi:hypothetical protein